MYKNHYIANKIKQPAQCCIHCGKSYKLKTNLNKHSTLCELIYNSKRKTYLVIEEEEELPSQKNMYKMLLEMAQKYNQLEEKVNEMNKLVIKKKKKMNVLDWLNSNRISQTGFGNLTEKIIVTDEDIQYLLNNTFYDTINELFNKTIYNINENNIYPIYGFIEKPNTIYIYDIIETNNNNNNETKEKLCWQECSKENLIKFFNSIHLKISKYFYNWKKNKTNEINQDENFATLCDKTLIKLMNIDLKQDTIYNKLKNQIYNKMKTELKLIVEFEYEF